MTRAILSTIPAQIIAICAIAAATMLLPVTTTVEARIAGNGLAENRIALNRIALNKIALNKIAMNRLSSNRIATHRIAFNGVVNGAPNPLVGMDRRAIAR